MIKELKFILKGIKNYLKKRKRSPEDIERIINELKKYSKDKYMKTYTSNFEREDSDLSDEEKKEEASYYFEYVFKHEEHPN